MKEILEKNKYGFYSTVKKYSADELNSFYKEKYYQLETSQYSNRYSKAEIDYFLLAGRELVYILNTLCSLGKMSISEEKKNLDLGGGEGWLLRSLREEGFEIKGVDFSTYGIKEHNPDLLDFVVQGDLVEVVKDLKEGFDVITLKNVLEHVISPAETIECIRDKIKKDGVVVVNVPNDFSRLQLHLKNSGLIKSDFWIVPPEHLHYFSSDSLNNFMGEMGFDCIWQTTDFPIDFDLLSVDTNYHLDNSLGKGAHNRRVAIENYLGSVSMETLVKIHNELAKVGLGRSVINFYKVKV